MRIFDLHTDTMMDILVRAERGETDILARCHMPDYVKGEIGAQIFAAWIPATKELAEEHFGKDPGTAQEIMMKMLAKSIRELRESKAVGIAYNTGDIERIAASGKIPVILGMEGFYGFNGEPEMIDLMYELGIRHGMLTWNNDNEFGCGAEFSGEDRGLTDLGKATVRRMEELGMIIDVSHASEKSFRDIMFHTNGPVIASHSNAWSLCSVPRNLKDWQIRTIAASGGVIGMNGWKGFIREDMETADVNGLAAHARYIADLVGPEYVACGFDFSNYLNPDEGTPGIEDASKAQNFVMALRDAGFTEEETRAICWDNATRVIKAVLG